MLIKAASRVPLGVWAETFRVDVAELEVFLKAQGEVQTREWAASFLRTEYNSNLPTGDVLVVLPKNTPHLWVQELVLGEVGGYSPWFLPPREHWGFYKQIKESWIPELNLLDVVTSRQFQEVRSYGRQPFGLGSGAREIFHGPILAMWQWSEGSSADLLRSLHFLNGRGCLTPTAVVVPPGQAPWSDGQVNVVKQGAPWGVWAWQETMTAMAAVFGASQIIEGCWDLREVPDHKAQQLIQDLGVPGFGCHYVISRAQAELLSVRLAGAIQVLEDSVPAFRWLTVPGVATM